MYQRQLSNALSPIETTLDGIESVERLVQFLNAQKFIFVSVLGRLTLVSAVQPRNALEPISAMPLGTIIVFKVLLNEKQLLSMPTISQSPTDAGTLTLADLPE